MCSPTQNRTEGTRTKTWYVTNYTMGLELMNFIQKCVKNIKNACFCIASIWDARIVDFLVVCFLVWVFNVVRHSRVANNQIRNINLAIVTLPLVHALFCYLGLYFFRGAETLELVRDSYEAFCIFLLLQLWANFLGGFHLAHKKLKQQAPSKLFAVAPLGCCFRCCCSPIQWKHVSYMLFVRLGTFQYSLVLPLTGLLAVFLAENDAYRQGVIDFSEGYIYITIAQAFSLLLCMYCLVIFERAAAKLLKGFRPMFKFACIKLIALLAVVQGFFFAILVRADALRSDDTFDEDIRAQGWQNFVLIIEMAAIELAMVWAFPVRDSIFGLEMEQKQKAKLEEFLDVEEGGVALVATMPSKDEEQSD
ncbi:hypothetical protein QOT17_006103 [Balamuthia mandrillaris]